MSQKPKRKRMTYFLNPNLVDDVKTLAGSVGGDQSDVVEQALVAHIEKSPNPKLKTKPRSRAAVSA